MKHPYKEKAASRVHARERNKKYFMHQWGHMHEY